MQNIKKISKYVLIFLGITLVFGIVIASADSFSRYSLSSTTIADATTYYIQEGVAVNCANCNASNSLSRVYIPVDGTITAISGTLGVEGTLSSGENSTVGIRDNSGNVTVVSSTVETNATLNNYSNYSMSVHLDAGQYFDYYLTTATFATNPTSLRFNAMAHFEPDVLASAVSPELEWTLQFFIGFLVFTIVVGFMIFLTRKFI